MSKKELTSADVAYNIAVDYDLKYATQVNIEAYINTLIDKGISLKEAKELVQELLDYVVQFELNR